MTDKALAVMGGMVASALVSFIKFGPIFWMKGGHGRSVARQKLSLAETAQAPQSTVAAVDLSGFLCRLACSSLKDVGFRDAVLQRLLHELLVSIFEVTGKRYDYVGDFNDDATWEQVLEVLRNLQARNHRNLYGGRA